MKTAAMIGLGALGVMFGQAMQQNLGSAFHVIVDRERRARYEHERVSCNGEPCHFNFISPDEASEPIDLIIFGTKYGGLPAAVETARPFVGENTVVMTLVNGIISEEVLARAYGKEKVLYAIALGMDAKRTGNTVEFKNIGRIEFGEDDGSDTPRVHNVSKFLTLAGVPNKVTTQIQKLFWGKLMVNTGINQAVTAYEGTYGDVQKPGEPRDTMIAAMREVISVSQAVGVCLTEEDLGNWLAIADTLNPESCPSMRQDAIAKRETEVELFSGTIIRLGKEHGIPTPVNDRLYDIITHLPIEA